MNRMYVGISEKVAFRCSEYFFDHSKVRFKTRFFVSNSEFAAVSLH
jgi:hypothetical protein